MLAISDLLGANRVTDAEGGVVDEFAESWDMAPLTTIDRHRRAIENAGFEIEAVRDITHNRRRTLSEVDHAVSRPRRPLR